MIMIGTFEHLISCGTTAIPSHLTACEALVGEAVASRFPLTVLREPSPGAAIKNADATVTLSVPGEYRFKFGEAKFGVQDISIIAFEQRMLDMIPIGDRTIAERRLVLRSLAVHSDLPRSGRVADYRGIGLAAYGA